MHVVWSRCAALRAVVEDKIVWKSRRESEHRVDFAGDILASVAAMDNRKVAIKDGKRIEVNDVVIVKRNATLFRIEILRAEKTWPFGDRVSIDRCGGTRHAVRKVTHENIEP